MDYKELIEQLKDIVNHGDECPAEYCTNRCGGCDVCEKSSDAIETLLAEREALVAQICGQCGLCANRQRCISDEGLKRDCAVGNRRYWQWRGPQKGGS